MKNPLKEKIIKWPVIEGQDIAPTCYVVYDGKFQIKWASFGELCYVSKHTKEGKWIKWLNWRL